MFTDRKNAGKLLGEKLFLFKEREVLVAGIPRGGVVTGNEVARALGLKLTAVVVKKISSPVNRELAIGAVAPENIREMDWELALREGVTQDYLDREIALKRKEVEERIRSYGLEDTPLNIKKTETVLIVDDGIATGETATAAIKFIKKKREEDKRSGMRIILAVPVVAKDAYERLKSETDGLVALEIPDTFESVGRFYESFPQVTDRDVINILSGKE